MKDRIAFGIELRQKTKYSDTYPSSASSAIKLTRNGLETNLIYGKRIGNNLPESQHDQL